MSILQLIQYRHRMAKQILHDIYEQSPTFTCLHLRVEEDWVLNTQHLVTADEIIRKVTSHPSNFFITFFLSLDYTYSALVFGRITTLYVAGGRIDKTMFHQFQQVLTKNDYRGPIIEQQAAEVDSVKAMLVYKPPNQDLILIINK